MLSSAKCKHGFDPISSREISLQFAVAFRESFYKANTGDDRPLLDCLEIAEDATLDDYTEVWNDSANMKNVFSLFLFNGTQHIRNGDYVLARTSATFARYFETQCYRDIDDLSVKGDPSSHFEQHIAIMLKQVNLNSTGTNWKKHTKPTCTLW